MIDIKSIKKWYEQGLWDIDAIAIAVSKGVITAEDYTEITGTPYEEEQNETA